MQKLAEAIANTVQAGQ
ncbi:beta-class phenol-soluble modulin, partial [Staphylococcus croceilyticus]